MHSKRSVRPLRLPDCVGITDTSVHPIRNRRMRLLQGPFDQTRDRVIPSGVRRCWLLRGEDHAIESRCSLEVIRELKKRTIRDLWAAGVPDGIRRRRRCYPPPRVDRQELDPKCARHTLRSGRRRITAPVLNNREIRCRDTRPGGQGAKAQRRVRPRALQRFVDHNPSLLLSETITPERNGCVGESATPCPTHLTGTDPHPGIARTRHPAVHLDP